MWKVKQTKESMMDTDPVKYNADDGVATITLNRPAAMNAMTNGLMGGISRALTQVAADETVRVVVITGEGRGFCAGADLAHVAEGNTAGQDEAGENETDDGANGSGTFNTAMRALMDCPVPTIARVNGPAAGGGFGLALACDVTIAARSAFFVATFGPRLGIVPDMGATWSIPLRVGRARALGITLLGDRITAQEAEDWGMIWRCVDDDKLDDEVARIASTLANSSPSTVTRIRSTIDAAIHNSFSDQLDLEMVHQGVLSPRNMREGALAFMQKREPHFGGERD
jgi:2-(1,2-epoxy-1,2-dihydrophenyl)acetyl-CoA isomerase